MADKPDAPAPDNSPPVATLVDGWLRIHSTNPCSVQVQSRDAWETFTPQIAGPREIKGNIAVRDEVTKGVLNIPCTLKVKFRNG